MSKLSENEELLLKANSVEEVKTIVAEHGGTVTEEEAKELYDKIKSYDPDAVVEVSEDELEEVSGGGFIFPNRSVLKEGCKATVEGGSSCWGNDACKGINVIYVCDPDEKLVCPNCKTKTLVRLKAGGYRCHICKFEGTKEYLSN